MKFLIINGPNLNMLGIREPDLYGTLTYDGLVEYVAAEARRLGVEAEFYQSNHEGDLVTAIQQAHGRHRHQRRGLYAYQHRHSGRA